MVVLESELAIYNSLRSFIDTGLNYTLFVTAFGFTPSKTNIKRKLKLNKNFMSDEDIIKKILSLLPDEYVVGSRDTTDISFNGETYDGVGEYILWVHKILK